MTLKPPKKSDRNKTWMKNRKDKLRRIQPERHLVITEGTVTEPAYFNAMKGIIDNKYRGKKLCIEVCGKGNNTLNLFSKAQEEVRKNPNGYRHIWIVYDIDEYTEEQVNGVVEACQEHSTDEVTYHAIWSNQCFEVWYVLHFEYLQSNIERQQYVEKITGYLMSYGKGVYTKNRKDMYEILFPYMQKAIAYAKKLEKHNHNKQAYQSNPGTKVYELIETLKPYLD